MSDTGLGSLQEKVVCWLRALTVALGAVAASAGIGSAEAASYNEVHKCDEFAAHPSDPNKWASGVSDDDLVTEPALKYCQQAVRDYPDTPRFQYQLGRALAKSGRAKEAVQAWVQAAAAGYAPAYAYIGDAYFYGVGLPDGEQQSAEHGRSWYQKAKDAGFALEDYQAENLDQETNTAQGEASGTAVAGFEPSLYIRNDILQALYRKDFAYLDKIRVQVILYFNEFNNFFKGDNSIFSQSGAVTCQALYDPSMAVLITNDWMYRSNPIFGSRYAGNQQERMNNMFKSMASWIQGYYKAGPIEGMRTLTNASLAIQQWKEQGTTDAKRVVVNLGCDHDFVRTIYANAKEYFQT